MEMLQSFLTNNQLEIKSAFQKAASEKMIVAVFDHPGSGFKYALNDFLVNHSYVRAAYGGILHNAYYHSQLPIELSRHFMQIRFSNLNYKKTDARDLIRVLGQRIKRDLLGKSILLVFDNVDRLKTEPQLTRFMGILKCINFKCGVVIRTTKSHLDRIEATMSEKVFADFSDMTKTRKVLPRNSKQDVQILCRIHGIKNTKLAEEIADSTLNFRIAMTKVQLHNGFKPTTQLSIQFI